GAETAPSLEAAIAMCADAGEVMVIGGGQIYAECMHMATNLELTLVDGSRQFHKILLHSFSDPSGLHRRLLILYQVLREIPISIIHIFHTIRSLVTIHGDCRIMETIV
ncbi:MAG: dihydrofolate reductase, partial [Lachnospiraceae bacterium]|nr:dihydrofolate reductase [Lachnospiraceae bacterium]